MKTLKDKFLEKKNRFKHAALLNCPFCGSLYEELNVDGSWRDFFRFEVEGNFWQLLFFLVKVVFVVYFVVYSIFYISADAIFDVLQKPEVIQAIKAYL